MEKLVPCLCYLCNGKLVSRYIRRQHARVCSSTNQEQTDSSSNQDQVDSDRKRAQISREEAEHDIIYEDNQLVSQQSDEEEVC